MRITEKMINARVEQLNAMRGLPNELYQPRVNPKDNLVANAGVAYLQGAYGGYRIEVMCKGGGSRDLLNSGFGTKREVFNTLVAYMDGYDSAKNDQG